VTTQTTKSKGKRRTIGRFTKRVGEEQNGPRRKEAGATGHIELEQGTERDMGD